jgi:integrase
MTKRANGEGTIVHRKSDGRWQGQAYVLLPNGARVRRTVYGRTRAEVHEKVTALVHQAQRGVPAANTALTVGEYLMIWLDEVARRKLRPKTYSDYELVVRKHLMPTLGRYRLARLSPSNLRQLLNAKADEGLAPGTVKKIHVVIGSALQAAVRDDLLTRNVARLVQVPVPRSEPVGVLDVDDARRLLDAARNDRLYALWAVALGVGLRKGEALGLRWSDVDLEAGWLQVRQSLQRVAGHLQLSAPKTSSSRRSVPLPRVCVEALEAHRRTQEEERRALGAAWHDSGLVFTTPLGTPIDPRNVIRALNSLCERAGVRRIRVHDLRHTCATLLLVQGVHPRVVMEVLGHSRISVTMDVYTHVVSAVQREAATLMHQALTGAVAVNVAVNGAAGGSSGDSREKGDRL